LAIREFDGESRGNKAGFYLHHNWKKPYRNALLQLTTKVISLPTKVFKHVFGQESDFLSEKEDFSKLPLSSHWYFKLNVHGQGVKLSFPVRVKCIVKNKKLYLPVCSVSTLKVFPVEKLVLISATTVCTIDNC
jgi:hypothetical protein